MSSPKRRRYYVGHSHWGVREIILTDSPSEQNYWDKYFALTGPFRSRKAAQVMIDGGDNNPHTQTTAQCNKIAHNR